MNLTNRLKLNQIQRACESLEWGEISIDNEVGKSGGIFFEKGKILHAEYGCEIGYRALANIIRLEDSSMMFPKKCSPEIITINEPLDLVFQKLENYDEIRGGFNQEEENEVEFPEELVFQENEPKPKKIIYQLKVVSGSQEGNQLELREISTTVGREKDCQISFPEATISRYHCRFFYHQEALWLEDLQSSNGTYLNEKKINKGYELHSGDLVQLGQITLEVQAKVKRAIVCETETQEHSSLGMKEPKAEDTSKLCHYFS